MSFTDAAGLKVPLYVGSSRPGRAFALGVAALLVGTLVLLSVGPPAHTGPASRAYWITDAAGKLAGRSGAIALRFTSRGIALDTARGDEGVALRAVGRGTDLRPAAPTVPLAARNRVTYVGPGLTMWYENGPAGVEQGFTLQRRPAGGPAAGPLRIEQTLSGDLVPALLSGGLLILHGRRGGDAGLRYGGLHVTDRSGRVLPARLVLRGHTLQIVIDDAGAAYPVTVDPTFTQVDELTASNGAASDELGYSVAISGSTVAVGAPGANSGQGAVYVYVNPSGAADETAELTASDGHAGDAFGTSVAIQGGTIVVGAPNATVGAQTGQGAAYVFTEPGAGWATSSAPTAKLTASAGAAGDLFGTSVAIDGATIAVGAPGAAQISETANVVANQDTWCNATAPGSAYVFTEPGGGWTATGSPTAKLTGSPAASVNLGTSVAVSGDTVVAGAPCATGGGVAAAGEVGLFVEPPSGWVTETQDTWLVTPQQTPGDSGPGPVRGEELGTSVAMSGDTIVAGAPSYVNSAQPSTAFVFYRPDGEPPFAADTLSNAELTPPDGSDEDRNGASAAIDGGVLAIGGPIDNSGNGIQGAYTESGGSWTLATSNPSSSPGTGTSFYGAAIGVSGQTTVGGAPGQMVGANANQGEAFVFGAPGPTAATGSASSVTFTTAALSAAVNPQGSAITSCSFSWGTSTAYGNTAPCVPASPGSGTSPVLVSAALSGLHPGTTYHFQLVTVNAAGQDVSADQQFTTTGGPVSTAAPSISGKAQQGQILTEGHGAWTNGPTSFGYAWEDCNSAGTGCTAIPGATNESYKLTANDVGHTIRVAETATNPAGSGAPRASAPTATVGLAPPVLSKTVNVLLVKGKVTIKLPHGRTFNPLVKGEQIPVGSIVNATHGTVSLTSAKVIRGVTQTANFYDGEFIVKQKRGQSVTTLVLTGGGGCVSHGVAVIARRHPRRSLWGSGHGSFTTQGSNAAAAVRGTIWLTEDFCDGTYVLAKRDTVLVHDFVTGRSVTLHTGQSFFASANVPKKKRK